MPSPSTIASWRVAAWVMVLPGGTLRVSQTLPAIVEPRPTVIRPSTDAPAGRCVSFWQAQAPKLNSCSRY